MRPWLRATVACVLTCVAIGFGLVGRAAAAEPAPLMTGDLLPLWLEQQAKVLHTETKKFVQVEDLACSERLESGQEACRFHGASATAPLHQGGVITKVLVLLYWRGLGSVGRSPTENLKVQGLTVQFEPFDAGVRAYVQNYIPSLHKARGPLGQPPVFRAHGGARAEFRCGNAQVQSGPE